MAVVLEISKLTCIWPEILVVGGYDELWRGREKGKDELTLLIWVEGK